MKVVFAGTPAAALPSLQAVADSRHDLAAVLTRPDARVGRGRKLARSPVAEWGDANGVDVLTPIAPKEPEFLEQLRQIAPDCVVVVAYGALAPAAALEVPTHGWVNLHFSLLPAWRGAAPVQHALLHGDEVTGASVFQLETGLDTGPVFGTVTENIRPRDTAGELLQRLSQHGAQLLTQVLDAVDDGAATAVPQPGHGVSLAPKIGVDDARVRWDVPAFAVDRRVRAMTPDPGAWTTWGGQRVRITPVTIDPEGPRLSPGQVEVGKSTVHVGTAGDPVRLDRLQVPGKKYIDAAAWGRGLAERDGVVFE